MTIRIVFIDLYHRNDRWEKSTKLQKTFLKWLQIIIKKYFDYRTNMICERLYKDSPFKTMSEEPFFILVHERLL